MNLPNKLTLIRVALVPICLMLLEADEYVLSALLFAVASLTDFVDGHIARKRHLVTNFGKFADPIADKILTLSMMILLSAKGILPAFLPCVVVIRELMVDGLRLIAMEQGQVMPAGKSGKLKTVLQMLCVLSALMFPSWPTVVFSAVVCAVTVYSGAEYFVRMRGLFKEDFKQ